MARRIGASFSRQSLDLSCSLLNLTRASRRASVPFWSPDPSASLLVFTNFQESVPQSSGTSMCSGQIQVAGQVGRGQVGVPGQVGRERSESGGRLDGAGGSPTLPRYLVFIPVPLGSPRRVSQLHVSGAFFDPERQCHESARRSTCVALRHRSSGLDCRDTPVHLSSPCPNHHPEIAPPPFGFSCSSHCPHPSSHPIAGPSSRSASSSGSARLSTLLLRLNF